ncbi:MAG TPA: aspartate kinase [Rhabdochlamydiaceae bacterium]|nr:aspartate kinase [Rhabdochlamydiaceae bacterium]
MDTLVLKFGGAAVAKPERFSQIADLILERTRHYKKIVVVVSAMGNMTDELLTLARQVHPSPPKREQDMLISVGERISMSLLAMALDLKDKVALSLTGSQAGIITTSNHAEAKIIDVRPHRVVKALDEGKIVIVAGFQGVSKAGEITTLGRGGSDITAVALAVALGAEKVEFYKDVPGIFAEDPKKNPDAEFYSTLNYTRALEITQKGAKVLQSRCIDLAARNNLPLHVLPFSRPKESGTLIGKLPRLASPALIYEDG